VRMAASPLSNIPLMAGFSASPGDVHAFRRARCAHGCDDHLDETGGLLLALVAAKVLICQQR
jgi:hypothetical protein